MASGEPEGDGAGDGAPAATWLAWAIDAERRGDLLTAVDLAERGLDGHPDDLWLRHRLVLDLARAGATEEALRRFEQFGLDASGEEDVAALGARLAKDVALAATGEERRRAAAVARDRYTAVAARTGGYYPAINAATLSLVAGDAAGAATRARGVLDLLRGRETLSYYEAATEAEAHLLLDDHAAATAALREAAGRHDGDLAAVATTRRQLRIVCELRGSDPAVLDVLKGPAVVHFCGHRIAAPGAPGRFPADAERAVAATIALELERDPAGYGYGALAGGADIMWAEALLASGAELHVVLPFAVDAFVASSVAPSGPGWVERFQRCIGAATSVRTATDHKFAADDVLYRYGSELAMGLALVRARHLDVDVRQLAVWDGGPAHGDAGTAIDVATWRAAGRAARIVAPAGPAPAPAPATPQEDARPDDRSVHVVRAMLFADVKGFSKLTDEQLPRFMTVVFGALAEVLGRFDERILYRNTWGDAVYVVIADAVEAAECALALQEALHAIDFDDARLPAHLALRLGGHVGPVFETLDPVLGRSSFVGSHVSRTARIEPITPPGAVYVTDSFAAALELSGDRTITCDYVGHMPAAKDFGRLRMYRLHRRP
ncbi:MAG: hypothetical protein JWN46_907 [Acidimicrobiales bacterium]|nr:hypothetical protein [Acidimicrobiales bacterium]